MDDLISRQAAIDALDELCDRECEYSKKQRSVMCGACHLGSAFDAVEALPSAQPERKHGKWIKHAKGFWTFVNANGERDGWLPDYECSECGSRGHDMICVYNFCPMCGAEMEMESEWT